MTLSRQNLSIIIVSFLSEHVIYKCIDSIPSEIKIIVVDNSNNIQFKKELELKYQNVECILSSQNLGMGAGNNLGLKQVKTDFVLILNPDVILNINTIDKLIEAADKIESFGIIAPISNSSKFPNFQLNKNQKKNEDEEIPFKVKSVDGFAMLFNLKKLNLLNEFKNFNYFDENIFLYLENDDICKRLIDNKESIYVVANSKIEHLGASAVNKKYNHEIELSRNWHWIWSKFYFNSKHRNYFFALLEGMPSFLTGTLKYLFYLLLQNTRKKEIYLHRCLGFINAVLCRKSYYRPKIDY